MFLAKLSYFTNLDFPKVRGFPFQKATFWGENSCEVAIIWPDVSIKKAGLTKGLNPAVFSVNRPARRVRKNNRKTTGDIRGSTIQHSFPSVSCPRHPDTSWEGIWTRKTYVKHLLSRYLDVYLNENITGLKITILTTMFVCRVVPVWKCLSDYITCFALGCSRNSYLYVNGSNEVITPHCFKLTCVSRCDV